MGNCLVTKLAGVVQNDDLEKLGEIRINYNENASQIFSNSKYITLRNSMEFHISSNYDMFDRSETNLGRSITVPANTAIDIAASTHSDAWLKIDNKYTLTSVALINTPVVIDLNSWNYTEVGLSPSGKGFTFKGEWDCAVNKNCTTFPFVVGKVKNYEQYEGNPNPSEGANIVLVGDPTTLSPSNKYLNRIYFAGDGCDLSLIASKFTNFGYFDLYSLPSTGFTGDFTNIGKIQALTGIRFTGTGYIQSALSFVIERFVAYRRGAGITEGSITINSPASYVRFNEAPVAASWSVKQLSWTGTTITYDGVTIQNDDVINA